MEKFVVEGGYSLSGRIKPTGNKNAALPILAATLLTDDEVQLSNVPRIKDVEMMVALLKSIGSEVQWLSEDSLRIKTNIPSEKTIVIEKKYASEIRASILLAGPLIARGKNISFPPPGGDVIGRRRLDTHFYALETLGAKVRTERRGFFIEAERLEGAVIFLDEPSVTATENAIMASSLAKGKTTIKNAASEPHVQNLINFLQKLGGHIKGCGSNVLEVFGSSGLSGGEWRIIGDHIEVGSFISLAAVTGGELIIENAETEHLPIIKYYFSKIGVEVEIDGNNVLVPGKQRLVIKNDHFGEIPTIYDAPWPGFPSDLTSIAVVTATQASGTVLIFEKMFDGRLFFVDKLVSMGARIVLCDPHRVVIAGPSKLYASELVSPDIRAGMALLIASLCAEGKSVIHNIGQIDRGYYKLEERLAKIGARIKRVDE
ncbi:MAG: UDP-N-acetylglucosamine 1-carboxyvinyltransferase [Spirochaetes bacterium]|nr:MAG: UDP-N-acetylglucosamine 1-carboxyvinyltransferase [Spirochaetota bacterium]